MSSSPKKYDVFISFRGEDTRPGFTSHLHTALCKQNIETFIDNNNLKRGDEIGSALVKAIKDSHISVVVFSVNYASSKWCLEELRQILECRKYGGQVVIPVFYKIDPSHVRHQTGSYRKAFAKHERDARNNKSKVSQWRAALTEIANISGWDSSTYTNDSHLIEKIVNDVWQKLPLMYPNELKGLVEIDENWKHIESLLNKFQRIGIWGMGGIGKTTIAKQMFAKHFAQYDSACFLEKVREESEKFGLASVRNKLFSELLKRQITTSHALGETFLQRRLSSNKVFIVLDDVDNAVELEYLCKQLGDLGSHSRLIITTRNRHILRQRVDEIYEVPEWKFPDSLKLFSLGAFEQTDPKKGYGHLSERAVTYAGGVPIALKVLGLHFHSRNAKFWESELSYFESRKESFKEIREVLQVSYKGLREQEQAIFLDIAFFFKDENKDFVTRILNACGFNATSGIEILEDKSLITISKSNRIQMHDLLQEMGLDIVRKTGRRSRLNHIEEVRDVLENKKGTDTVEGITLDLSQKVDLHLRAETFNMMPKLRFLRLYVPLGKKRLANVSPPEFLKPCSDELRYLEWNGYTLKSLPPKFCVKFLVEIRMPHSHIQELWQGTQDLVNLETIDLSECKQLTKLPDLSKALKLKWVYLSGCGSLCVVHPSLLSVDTLEILILNRCTKLKSLKSEKHLSCLQKLDVNDCSSLKEFLVSSDSIETLDLSKTRVKKLDSSIGSLSKLKSLNLEGLSLQNLPDELSWLKSLEEFKISNCGLVNKKKLDVLCNGLLSLKLLHLKVCDNLFELPDNINALSSLYELRLDGSNVQKLPTNIKFLKNLEILSLENCWGLQTLPELPPLIKELYVVDCTSLVTVSTLKTFSVKMKGNEKNISFKNGMKLDELSLLQIMEGTRFTMKSAAMQNVFVRSFGVDTNSYKYNSVGVCLPGSSVPDGFMYRTTESSITIKLPSRDHHSHLLGFIYSVVLSPSSATGPCHAKIKCMRDGGKVGIATAWHHSDIRELESDHILVWYDPFHCDSILDCSARDEPLELCVTVNIGEGLHMKEFGIDLIRISDSELPNYLWEAEDLESDLRLELRLKFQLALGLLQESNGCDWEVASKLCLALENGDELDGRLKSEFESRCKAISSLIEKERDGIQDQEQNLSDRILDRLWDLWHFIIT